MDTLPNYNILTITNNIDSNNELNNDTYALFQTDDLISNNIRIYGSFEPNLIKVALKYLYDKNKNVLDIGANIGTFTIPIAKRIKGTVYSFEVQRHIFMQLCTNCFLNKLANVYPVHGLLCDKDTYDQNKYSNVNIVNLYNSINSGAYSVNKKYKRDYDPPTTNEIDQVKNIYIDELNFTNIGLIKMDVEGAESNILKGMINTIKSNNYPPIIFECISIEEYIELNNNLFELFKNIDYKIYSIENETTNYIAFHKDFVII